MENEILTGKNVNEAKKKVTDEEVNKLLKSAQEQLRKEIPVDLTKEEREAIEREKRKSGNWSGSTGKQRIQKSMSWCMRPT